MDVARIGQVAAMHPPAEQPARAERTRERPQRQGAVTVSVSDGVGRLADVLAELVCDVVQAGVSLQGRVEPDAVTDAVLRCIHDLALSDDPAAAEVAARFALSFDVDYHDAPRTGASPARRAGRAASSVLAPLVQAVQALIDRFQADPPHVGDIPAARRRDAMRIEARHQLRLDIVSLLTEGDQPASVAGSGADADTADPQRPAHVPIDLRSRYAPAARTFDQGGVGDQGDVGHRLDTQA